MCKFDFYVGELFGGMVLDVFESDLCMVWFYLCIYEFFFVDCSVIFFFLDWFGYVEIVDIIGFFESNVGVCLYWIK